jgi:hypothetical protein
VQVVQCLTELGLSFTKARITSDGGWFVDGAQQLRWQRSWAPWPAHWPADPRSPCAAATPQWNMHMGLLQHAQVFLTIMSSYSCRVLHP